MSVPGNAYGYRWPTIRVPLSLADENGSPVTINVANLTVEESVGGSEFVPVTLDPVTTNYASMLVVDAKFSAEQVEAVRNVLSSVGGVFNFAGSDSLGLVVEGSRSGPYGSQGEFEAALASLSTGNEESHVISSLINAVQAVQDANANRTVMALVTGDDAAGGADIDSLIMLAKQKGVEIHLVVVGGTTTDYARIAAETHGRIVSIGDLSEASGYLTASRPTIDASGSIQYRSTAEPGQRTLRLTYTVDGNIVAQEIVVIDP